jgi:hypothetical protein
MKRGRGGHHEDTTADCIVLTMHGAIFVHVAAHAESIVLMLEKVYGMNLAVVYHCEEINVIDHPLDRSITNYWCRRMNRIDVPIGIHSIIININMLKHNQSINQSELYNRFRLFFFPSLPEALFPFCFLAVLALEPVSTEEVTVVLLVLSNELLRTPRERPLLLDTLLLLLLIRSSLPFSTVPGKAAAAAADADVVGSTSTFRPCTSAMSRARLEYSS